MAMFKCILFTSRNNQHQFLFNREADHCVYSVHIVANQKSLLMYIKGKTPITIETDLYK